MHRSPAGADRSVSRRQPSPRHHRDRGIAPAPRCWSPRSFCSSFTRVPVAQVVLEKAKDEDSMRAGSVPPPADQGACASSRRTWSKASTPRTLAAARAACASRRWDGSETSSAVVGHGGWLYYTPGVTVPRRARVPRSRRHRDRRRAALERGEGPRPRRSAARNLRVSRSAEARGIALVLFPVPDKAMLQPSSCMGAAGRNRARSLATGLGSFRRRDASARRRGLRPDAVAPRTG